MIAKRVFTFETAAFPHVNGSCAVPDLLKNIAFPEMIFNGPVGYAWLCLKKQTERQRNQAFYVKEENTLFSLGGSWRMANY